MIPVWRETEYKLLAHFPGMSVEELIHRRDHAWFGQPKQHDHSIPLADVLQHAAHELITPDAGIASLRFNATELETEQRRRWRWLTFSLPSDLLLAAAHARSDQMELVSSRLKMQLKEGGFAEPHLHLKAALDFPTLWASLMRRLAQPDARADMLKSPGAEWDEGRGLAPLLLSCALARLLLAAFLSDTARQTLGFREYLDTYQGYLIKKPEPKYQLISNHPSQPLYAYI